MADIALEPKADRRPIREATRWDLLRANRNWLGFWFMLPAMAFLILFLAYPLGLGVWISFTDARIGRPGNFIGTENYEWLWDDSIFWLSVFNTLLYTTVASAIKFAIGLYLALLLNESAFSRYSTTAPSRTASASCALRAIRTRPLCATACVRACVMKSSIPGS